MKIEKLACCLAHPVTALRAIKEKVNEIIDGLEDVQAGGGGSAGATLIEYTATGEVNENVGGYVLTTPETFDSISALIQQNVIPTARIDMGGQILYLVLIMRSENITVFGATVGGTGFELQHDAGGHIFLITNVSQ